MDESEAMRTDGISKVLQSTKKPLVLRGGEERERRRKERGEGKESEGRREGEREEREQKGVLFRLR
jgi:hypothetical protein